MSTNTQRHSRHSTNTASEFHAEAPQATASEALAQGPYVATRAGFEPMTLQTKGSKSTNEPHVPQSYFPCRQNTTCGVSEKSHHCFSMKCNSWGEPDSLWLKYSYICAVHFTCGWEVEGADMSDQKNFGCSQRWLYNLPSHDNESLSSAWTTCASTANRTRVIFHSYLSNKYDIKKLPTPLKPCFQFGNKIGSLYNIGNCRIWILLVRSIIV